MAVTVASFKAEYDEFALTPDVKVQAKIDAAALEIGEAWALQRDDAIKLLAAHLLWLSPLTEPSHRGPETRSQYIVELERMRASSRVGFFGTAPGIEGGL